MRHDDLTFSAAVEHAARLGYEYLEPCLLNGRDFLAEAEYYHFRSMDEDPLEVKEQLAAAGLKPSAVSGDSPEKHSVTRVGGPVSGLAAGRQYTRVTV